MLREINEIQKAQEHEHMIPQINVEIAKNKKFSLIQRYITQRKDYKKYLLDRKAKMLEQTDDVATIQQKREKFDKIVKTLESNNIPTILTEEDKYITPNEDEYRGLDDFILVHKTNYIPYNSKIRTVKEAQMTRTKQITIDGKNYEYSYEREKNTIHFTINDETSTHMHSENEDSKYAILIPFTDVPKAQIREATIEDTFTEGGVDLTENTFILCPKGEKQKIQLNNPIAKIIEYEGENVNGYAVALLSAIGYRSATSGKWTWNNSNFNSGCNGIMEREGLETDEDCYETYVKQEEMQEMENQIIAIFKMIKRNSLIKNEEDISRIYEQLNNPDNEELNMNLMINSVLRMGGKGKEKKLRSIYEIFGKNGIIIPISNQTILNNLIKHKSFETINIEEIIPKDMQIAQQDLGIIEEVKKEIECYNKKGKVHSIIDSNMISKLFQKMIFLEIQRSIVKEEKMQEEQK